MPRLDLRSQYFGTFRRQRSTSNHTPSREDLAIMNSSNIHSRPPSEPSLGNKGMKQIRHRPLSHSAKQMLLGTLLGDGVMDWVGCRYGRFVGKQGFKQAPYCDWKAGLLAELVTTPPKTVKNGGWGSKLRVFSTVTSPAFEFLRTLCYRQDPRFRHNPRRLVTRVNVSWLNRLTWEGVAAWFSDDGSLSGSGNCRVAIFNTHAYSRFEVKLMVGMLRRRGLEAKLREVTVRDKRRFIIHLSARSTRKFVKLIGPYIHPALAYKIAVPELNYPACAFCGGQITEPIANFNRRRPCCRNTVCKRKRNRERGLRWEMKMGRATLNARVKEHRNRDAKAYRAKATIGRKRRWSDPVYRRKWNAWKRNWREKRRRLGLPPM